MATGNHDLAQSRFLLYGVPWETYLALRDLPQNGHVRMTYDRGALEMMTPSKRHEQFAVMIELLIHTWAEEIGIDILGCRTMTCRRDDLERGFEPDNCYYVAHEAQMRAREELDLCVDPPPDLAVEIDLSTRSVEKLDLYQAFGVPEVWRYDGDAIHVHLLDAPGHYVLGSSSLAFPGFPLADAGDILRETGRHSQTALLRQFRTRVRDNRAR